MKPVDKINVESGQGFSLSNYAVRKPCEREEGTENKV